MQPAVSIIIPVYNAEKYLTETIESAINQTWSNKEIVIVDDGSTDQSLVIARRYENDRIKVYSHENKGASAARNLGLLHTTGDYIQFLDADDRLNENKIKSQIEVLADHREHLGLCATVHFHDGTNPASYPVTHEWFSSGSDDPVDFLTKLYGGSLIGPEYGGMIQPNAWLTPKTLIAKAGLWNEMRNPDDDGEFFCRVILAGKGIKYAHEGINFYRKFNDKNSLSAQKNYEACKSILQSTQLKAKYLTAKSDSQQLKTVLSRLFWENAFHFYPYFTDLALIAQTRAKELAPDFKYNPYHKGLNYTISNIWGWKTTKYLQYLKQAYEKNN